MLKGSAAQIVYTPRSDATLEGEASALASVYGYLLKNHDGKKVAEPAPEPDGPDDAEDLQNDRTAKPSIPRE